MSASDRRILFTTQFPWLPPERNGQVTIVYPAGWAGIVRKICAEAAITAGAAVRLKPKGDENASHR